MHLEDCEDLRQNALDVQIEQNVHEQRNEKQPYCDCGDHVDLRARRSQLFMQFLLLESVAIRGFAHQLKPIFNPFEGVVLFYDLHAQFFVQALQFRNILIDRC